jgi:hypothetical protein
MLKKIRNTFFIGTIVALISTNASAMQFNLDASELIKNHDDLNVNYVLYSRTGPGQFNITGSQQIITVMWQHISDLINDYKDRFGDKQPCDNNDGKHSQISLSYVKNGVTFSEGSCQYIPLTNVTNITMTESGCSVH